MTRNERQLTPFVNFTARIPYALYERALDYCGDHRGVSLAQVIRDALTEYLERERAAAERKTP